ncbi:xylose isomerase [Ranunculus cassubicifolius]
MKGGKILLLLFCSNFLLAAFAAPPQTCPADASTGCGDASDEWEGEFFTGIPNIKYEDWLRFSVAFWHTFRGTGSDPFGVQTKFWPWEDGTNSLAMAKRRMKANFEFLNKLGVDLWCFHDKDIAPDGKTLEETNANLDEIVALAKELQEIDHKWARFLQGVVAHKKKIGFNGTLLIEPKPQEPTKHQYDWDAATTIAFLQKYGLIGRTFCFWMLILYYTCNHATLSGHICHQELETARIHGLVRNIDANTGDPQIGNLDLMGFGWGTETEVESLGATCRSRGATFLKRWGLRPNTFIFRVHGLSLLLHGAQIQLTFLTGSCMRYGKPTKHQGTEFRFQSSGVFIFRIMFEL